MLCIGRVWYPLGRITWGCFPKHLIDLFQRKTPSLGDQKVGENDAGRASGAPDKENLGFEVTILLVDHIRCDEADHEILCPVRGSRHSNTLRSDRKRKHSQIEQLGLSTRANSGTWKDSNRAGWNERSDAEHGDRWSS
jgi:hypothetical protein